MNRSHTMTVPIHIVATMRIQPPFSYACLFHGETCNPAGINADIFRAVMLFLGIEYTLILAEDDTTGYMLPNGTWRGMIGQMMRGEANMTASLIGVESERLNVIDYSAPVSYYDNGFIVQKPSSNAMRGGLPTFLISPLSSSIWYSLIGSLICMVILVCAANYILQRQSGGKSVGDAWFGVSRGLLRQTQIDPSLTGIQISMMAWEIALFFVASFYSAHLTSSLMITPKQAFPFNGMDEFSRMVYHNKYSVIRTDQPAKWRVRKSDSYNDTLGRLRLAFQWNPPVYVDTMKEVVHLITNNQSLVYFGSIYQLMDATASECDLIIIEDKFTMPNWLSFGFPKGSPMVDWISLSLHTNSFSVNSYLQRLYKRYAKKRICPDEERHSSSYVPLTMAHMQGAFICLLWGLFIALLICAVERSYTCYFVKKSIRAAPRF